MTNNLKTRAQTVTYLRRADPTAKLGALEPSGWYRCSSKRHGKMWVQWRRDDEKDMALFIVYKDPAIAGDTTTHANTTNV